MRKIKAFIAFTAALLICLCLCGCTKKIVFTNGKLPADALDIAIVLEAGETALLSGFDALRSADFSGSLCYDEIMIWSEANPSVRVRYTVVLADGKSLENTTESADLSAIGAEDADETVALLSYLPELKNIRLSDSFNAEHLQIEDLLLQDVL